MLTKNTSPSLTNLRHSILFVIFVFIYLNIFYLFDFTLNSTVLLSLHRENCARGKKRKSSTIVLYFWSNFILSVVGMNSEMKSGKYSFAHWRETTNQKKGRMNDFTFENDYCVITQLSSYCFLVMSFTILFRIRTWFIRAEKASKSVDIFHIFFLVNKKEKMKKMRTKWYGCS